MAEYKSTLKRKILNSLALATGNKFTQFLLDKNLELSRFFLGIDSGTWVETSGEFVAVQKAIEMGKEPFCILDVGANEGQFIKVVQENVPRDKKMVIHSFEPSKYTYDNLHKVIKDQNNIILRNLGLASEPGELTLDSDHPESGKASLTQRNLSHIGVNFDRKETVSVDTVDNYCKSQDIDKIDLLKIDVEGHELDVLKGTHLMLLQGRVNIVCFEFSSCNVDTRVFMRDFFDLFNQYNMTISRITPSGYLKPMKDYKDIYEQFGDSNYVAIKNTAA